MFVNKEIKKSNNIFLTFLKLIIILGLIVIVFFYIGYSNFKNDILVNDEIEIKINKGDKIESVIEKLNLNKYYFKLYLKNNNPDFKILEGNFKINSNSNINQIIEGLKNPIKLGEINITLLEGWNIFDIDDFLTNKNLIQKGEYINYVTNKEKIELLTEFYVFIEGLNTLEGFLYPDTYIVLADNFKINNLVTKQLDAFESKVYNELLTEINNEDIEKLINLASIVEKEEKNPNEKSTVAGILKKRLDNGWMIGADITVCYPHKLTAHECKMIISEYINEKSEYNTRTMKGLPKTPIGNPSFETIYATLNYKESEYWFYLHDVETGKIYYAKTNAEHEQNKKLHY